MSAVPHQSFPVHSYPSQNIRSRRGYSNRYINYQEIGTESKATAKNKASSPITNTPLPVARKLPAQLQILLLLQKGSFGLAFTLIVASITVYISTVGIPQLWSEEYRNLETLQRQERQLTAINETIKHRLAQQAQQKNQDLVPLSTANMIFIKPASTRPLPNKGFTAKENSELAAKDISFGY
jgi:hypothetical protein